MIRLTLALENLGPTDHNSGGDFPIAKGDKLSLNQRSVIDFEVEAMKKYAQEWTMPDLAFVLSVLRRSQANPGIQHGNAGKRVLRYLKKTQSYVLVYQHLGSLELICYSCVELGGCVYDRMPTSGYVIILAGGSVPWRSTKQSIMAVLQWNLNT